MQFNSKQEDIVMEITREMIIRIDETTDLEFRDAEAQKHWEDLVKGNTSTAAKSVMRFTRLWAKLMQHIINSEGKTVCEIAEETSYAAEFDCGTTGFSFYYSSTVLAQCWKHGDELKRWYTSRMVTG